MAKATRDWLRRLDGPEWVARALEHLIRIVPQGLQGSVQVQGREMAWVMPPRGILDDDQIAEVLSYVGRESGHACGAVSTNQVRKVQQRTADRQEP